MTASASWPRCDAAVALCVVWRGVGVCGQRVCAADHNLCLLLSFNVVHQPSCHPFARPAPPSTPASTSASPCRRPCPPASIACGRLNHAPQVLDHFPLPTLQQPCAPPYTSPSRSSPLRASPWCVCFVGGTERQAFCLQLQQEKQALGQRLLAAEDEKRDLVRAAPRRPADKLLPHHPLPCATPPDCTFPSLRPLCGVPSARPRSARRPGG